MVKVLDFGLAKTIGAASSSPDLTDAPAEGGRREGAVIGTAAYMSPEQARGRPSTSARTSGRSAACSTRC